MEEYVILVDEQDSALGTMEKMEAHEKGLLHRAFSVFLFNDQNELLLQKRAAEKYHSPNVWTNTCCSHPREHETIESAASRRLMEEMGIETELERKFSFIYKAHLEKGLTEHELDHVLIGSYSKPPTPNPEEVSDWRFISIPKLKEELAESPENYSAWFKICIQQVLNLF